MNSREKSKCFKKELKNKIKEKASRKEINILINKYVLDMISDKNLEKVDLKILDFILEMMGKEYEMRIKQNASQKELDEIEVQANEIRNQFLDCIHYEESKK